MDKRQRARLGIAIVFTVAVTLGAGSYLIYRIWDYRSADLAYDMLCEDVVRHAGTGNAQGNPDEEPHGNPFENPKVMGTDSKKGATDHNENTSDEGSTAYGNDSSLSPEQSGMPLVDWQELSASGKDIVGWLEIPALEIGYPVVKCGDNEYYLHHMPNGDYKRAGSIFMEAGNSPDFTDTNTILYGHNMENGSMFGKFRNMTRKDLEKSSALWICTKNRTYLYSIFSVHISEVGDSSYTLFGGRINDSEVREWIRKENERSYLDAEIPQFFKNRVITLSTCASQSNIRRVVQGVLVAEYTPHQDERPP